MSDVFLCAPGEEGPHPAKPRTHRPIDGTNPENYELLRRLERERRASASLAENKRLWRLKHFPLSR